MKPVYFSNHARKRMVGRGATETEIIQTIQSSEWQPALENKKQARKSFDYERLSPVNKQVYAFKTVHVIFVEEAEKIVVVNRDGLLQQLKEKYP